MAEFREDERIRNFETEVEILEEFEDGEPTLSEVFEKIGESSEVEVLEIKRGDQLNQEPEDDTRVGTGDILHIRGDMEKIKSLIKNDKIRVQKNVDQEHFPQGATYVVEIVLLPNSELIDKRLNEAEFHDQFNASVLAVRSRGSEKFSDLESIKLRSGDILLLQTDEKGQRLLQQVESTKRAPFLSMRRTNVEKVEGRKLGVVIATLVLVIALASLGVVPIMIAALGGVVVLNVTRVVSMNQAYRAIDWQVIFLIAGALSLGKALEVSGIDHILGDVLVDLVGTVWGPMAVVGALYLITSICTELMSNNAAAALLAPIAISIASSMGLDPAPLLLAIAFAGSASFVTPVGYQTNTMVYSAGNYRFQDFAKVGAPLNLIFWVIATVCIPWIYGF